MTTAAEVEQQLIDWYNKETESTTESFETAWEDRIRDLLGWHNGEVEIPAGTAKYVAEFGGEGQGDTVWVVFEVNGQYFQVFGSYASWDGEYWYGAKVIEVEPQLVTVTRYVRKPIQ